MVRPPGLGGPRRPPRTLTFLALRRSSAQHAAPQQGKAGTRRPTLHAALPALGPIRARLPHACTPAWVSRSRRLPARNFCTSSPESLMEVG